MMQKQKARQEARSALFSSTWAKAVFRWVRVFKIVHPMQPLAQGTRRRDHRASDGSRSSASIRDRGGPGGSTYKGRILRLLRLSCGGGSFLTNEHRILSISAIRAGLGRLWANKGATYLRFLGKGRSRDLSRSLADARFRPIVLF